MRRQHRSAQSPPESQHTSSTHPGLEEPEHQAVIKALAEEELEQLKVRLLSTLTHELRTPLASLRLAAGLLVSAPPAGATEDHQQLFQMILQSSDRLELLVNNLLDYARLEVSHLELHMETVDLRLILESSAHLLEPHYRAKRQTLDLHLPPDPVNVRGDPFRLRSVALALLDTACKRCPAQGRISVGCRVQEQEAQGWVCDTGPHVSDEEQERIFTRSYWQTEEDPPSLDTLGLGLPLAYGLMTLHEGRLWLAEPETQGDGVCFHFSLPLALS